MKFSRSFLIQIKEISKNCNDPSEVERIMKHTMKESQELLRTYYVVDLIRSLNQRDVGLQSVEAQVKQLCAGMMNRRKTLVKTIMAWKLKDAYAKMRKQRYNNTKVWREVKPVLQTNNVLEKYVKMWKEETKKVKKQLSIKRKNKIQLLSRKYDKTMDVPDVHEGITIKDQQIPETFTSEPQCYGGCKMDEKEETILRLPPKFAVYSRVDAVKLEAQVEKGLAKYRWDKSKDEQGREQSAQSEEVAPDVNSNTIDMTKLRATDFKFNKRVCLPSPLGEHEEIELQHLKSKMLKSVDQYIEMNSGVQWSNLTIDERNGMRSLKKRSNEKDLVIYQTDKSGRFSVDTTENYIKACEPHVVNDEVVTQHEYKKLESTMNAHSVFWTRILQAGKGTGHMDRIKGNMITTNTPLAPLYCLRKDHKTVNDPVVGPPVRPVCGATMSYNGRLSHLMSMLLNDVWKNEPDVCLSTEELLAGIRNVNSNNLEGGIMVGSADVKALYPSLDIDFTVEKVCEIFNDSNIVVSEVDIDELGLYLSLNCEERYLNDIGLLQYCPSRKFNRGRRPIITGCASEEDKTKRFMKWNSATNKPDGPASRKMLVEALRVALTFIMKNHVYTYNDAIYRQNKGGPIGLELTGVLAQVFMIWWDRELKRTMNEIGLHVHMYKRYVDDINIIMGIPQVDLSYMDSELHVIHDDVPIDKKCMQFVKCIANSIHPSIEVEVDHPSQHCDNKIPILDVKVWVEERDGCYVVLHEFYSKEISSKLVVHPRSAIPPRAKRTILTQEVLRVLLNCSPLLPWEMTVQHANMMVARMQYSGYDKSFRYDVVKSALDAYRKIMSMEQEGTRPMYRPREWKMKERRESKEMKRVNWYKKGHFSSVIFVPVTPDSRLKKMLEEDIKTSNVKIKIVEKAEVNIKKALQRSNPFKANVCGKDDCLVCGTSASGRCGAQGVTYQIECKGCGSRYIGETSRSAYTRGKEHLKDLDSAVERSILRTHCEERHDGLLQDFSMKVMDVFNGDPMLRQITEAVAIRREGRNAMNSKNEWNTIKIPRANIELL